jgi:hypothetical protein
MTPEANVMLFMAALVGGLVAATVAGRRRAPTPEPVAVQPRRRRPYRWYRTPLGLWTWDRERPDGSTEYGPYFQRWQMLGFMDYRWMQGPGVTSADLAELMRDVVCYYPRWELDRRTETER